MREKEKYQALLDAALANGIILPHYDKTELEQRSRIGSGCGSGWVGAKTWETRYSYPDNNGAKVTWNDWGNFNAGIVSKDFVPDLKVGHCFVRIPHGEKHLLITWEDK